MQLKHGYKKVLLNHFLYLLAAALYILIINLTGIHCPIRFFTGIPCPACGSSRALLCLIRLDFAGYLYYNPAALLILAAFFAGIHANTVIFKKFGKKNAVALVCVLSVIIFAFYIFRMCFSQIP